MHDNTLRITIKLINEIIKVYESQFCKTERQYPICLLRVSAMAY